MVIVNGRPRAESPATVHNAKPKTAERPKETAALERAPRKSTAKKRPAHGTETRSRTRR